MANKSVSMGLFVLSLIVLGPILVVSGFFALGWWWDSFTGCMFASPYSTCGYVEITKAAIFSFISFGCFTGIQTMWRKAK
jgi:hypothetical protein